MDAIGVSTTVIIGILIQFPFFIIFYFALGIKQVWG
jgi:hypothetical protein